MPKGASAMWVYRNTEGLPFHAKVRFDRDDGKTFRLLTHGTYQGDDGWHTKAHPRPYPLYGLDRLHERPDAPVLVVEGEKTADAASALFPDHVVVTFGASANADKTEYAALCGREVTIWPDHDEPGRKAAQQAATALVQTGAASVRIVRVSDSFAPGWDLADDAPAGADLPAMLAAAECVHDSDDAGQDVEWPEGYDMTDTGLYYTPPPSEKNKAPAPLWLSAPFAVLGMTRDASSDEWGTLIRWRDRDGKPHERTIPQADLAGDPTPVVSRLMGGGMSIATGNKRTLFISALARVHTPGRLLAVHRPGWHRTEAGSVFVLPTGQAFGKDAKGVALDTKRQDAAAVFAEAGTLAEWQDQIARYAVGNSRIAFCIAAALTGALLDIVTEQSGGFHLVGGSRQGKSTATLAAGSVWGSSRQMRAWRATANGLEGIAADTADGVLILDEIGQANPHDVGDIVYALSNETGKQRATRTGDARAVKSWRVLLLSTGEVSLADVQRQAGRDTKAGQATRLPSVPACPPGGFGVFETLHGFADGGALADHFRQTARQYHGTAGRAFLVRLVADRQHDEAGLKAWIETERERFIADHAPDAGSQARSVAKRFALVACAGELAARYGVLPWETGEATRAAAACFGAWLSENEALAEGGALEDSEAVERLAAFIAAHGESRFHTVETVGGCDTNAESRPSIINRAGFRWIGPGDAGIVSYGILPSVFRGEVCKGLNPKRALDALHRAGYLKLSSNGDAKSRRDIPAVGKGIKMYLVCPSILAGS